MTRVFLTIILPLLLPAALYVVWAIVTNRIRLAESAAWQDLPWTWLAVAGAALTAAVLVFFVHFSDNGEGVYVPPHVEDGQIVPGHVEPEPQAH
jgi:hypothetical protein